MRGQCSPFFFASFIVLISKMEFFSLFLIIKIRLGSFISTFNLIKLKQEFYFFLKWWIDLVFVVFWNLVEPSFITYKLLWYLLKKYAYILGLFSFMLTMIFSIFYWQVTDETCGILQEYGYTFQQRGLVSVKGKGQLMTFYLQVSINIRSSETIYYICIKLKMLFSTVKKLEQSIFRSFSWCEFFTNKIIHNEHE